MNLRLALRMSLLAIAALLFLAVAACGDDDDDDGGTSTPAATDGTATAAPTTPAGVTEPPEESLKVALSQLPDLLDPRQANPQTKIYTLLIFDPLIGVDRSGTGLSEETGIADSWTTDDNQTYTITIREGMTFSNGEALTSSDVVFSLGRILDEGASSPYSSALRGLIDSVEASDDTTVVITLTRPDFSFLTQLSPLFGTEGMIVPEDYVTEVGDDEFAASPIGSGPYVISDVNPGVSLTLEWSGEEHPIYGIPRYGEITYTSVTEQSTRTAMLETGEVDLIDLDLATTDPADLESAGFQIFEKAGQNVVGVQLHGQGVAEGWNNNEQFRKALALAINKEEIHSAIYRGYGEVTGVAFAGSLAIGYEALDPYPFDPDEAETILSDIGYDGSQVDVYAFDISGVPGLSQSAEVIAGYWSDVGINAQIQAIDYGSFRPLWFDEQIPGDSSVIGISNRPFAHAVYTGQFACDGSITYACDPDFDEIAAKFAENLGDESAYGGLVAEANQYIHDHYMSIPLVEVGTFYAGNDKLPAGWALGTGQYDFNAPDLVDLN